MFTDFSIALHMSVSTFTQIHILDRHVTNPRIYSSIPSHYNTLLISAYKDDRAERIKIFLSCEPQPDRISHRRRPYRYCSKQKELIKTIMKISN